MNNFEHDSYTVSWNANFYSKSFKDLDEAKSFAKSVDGIVMESIWYNGRTVDRALQEVSK